MARRGSRRKVRELKARSGRKLVSMRFSGDATFLRTYGEQPVRDLREYTERDTHGDRRF